MKKWLIGILLLFMLLISCAWLFIPSVLTVSSTAVINCNVNSTSKFMSQKDNWEKWWGYNDPANRQKMKKPFIYNGFNYQAARSSFHAVEVIIERGEFKTSSIMNVMQLANIDSVAVNWKCELKSGLNPYERIMRYREARNIKTGMDNILSNLSTFLQKKENIYGVNFHESMSKDSTLIVTKFRTSAYPDMTDIYKAIGRLKEYLAMIGAKENNYPMMHVYHLDSNRFETMVAIPTNKRMGEVKDDGEILFRRFVPWKVVTGRVRGGVYTINEALKQMKIYMGDYQKIAMALPFESLVTDRVQETDTLKWITDVYTAIP